MSCSPTTLNFARLHPKFGIKRDEFAGEASPLNLRRSGDPSRVGDFGADVGDERRVLGFEHANVDDRERVGDAPPAFGRAGGVMLGGEGHPADVD